MIAHPVTSYGGYHNINLTNSQEYDMISVSTTCREKEGGNGIQVTFFVNTSNHTRGSTGRFGLITMLSLVLMAKVAVLLIGAVAVPGGPPRHSTNVTVGISSSGLPIDAGDYTMTPLGAMWSRVVDRLRNRAVTPPRDDQADPAPRASHPPDPPR